MSMSQLTGWDRAALTTAAVGVASALAVVWSGWVAPWVSERPRHVSDWREYAEDGWFVGDGTSDVTIVMFKNYACGPSRYWSRVLDVFANDYIESLSIVYRDWPLPLQPGAHIAARSVGCAADQGHWYELHTLLSADSVWANSLSLTGPDSTAAFVDLARLANVPDLVEFARCVEDPRRWEAIERDANAVAGLGGLGTPTILINGLHFRVIPDSARFRKRIEGIIAR